MKRIVIIGSGLSGLASAWFIKQSLQAEILILEKKHRAGGWIQTIEKDGWRCELGPKGFRPQGKGEITLKLAYQLGLSSSLISSNESCRNRYLFLENRLQRITLFFLLRKYGLSFLKGFFTPSFLEKDISIDAFFSKRISPAFANQVIRPVIQGIFGGDSTNLSLRHCLPTFYGWEEKYGYFLKGILKQKYDRKLPALFSFEKGMQQLIETLSKKLQKHICLNTEVIEIRENVLKTTQGEVPFDQLIISHPINTSALPCLTLKTVHLGFSEPITLPKGFGYLNSCITPNGFLGMTWDYQLFSRNMAQKPLLCAMLRGEMKDETALEIALKALKEDLKILQQPSFVYISTALKAIPQFPVHYQLPSSKHLCIGSAAGAVGINESVYLAQGAADQILQKIT